MDKPHQGDAGGQRDTKISQQPAATSAFRADTKAAAAALLPTKFPEYMRHQIRIRRLQTEVNELTRSPVPHCQASPKGDDLTTWLAIIEAPEGCVYERGTFFVDLTFPIDYPFKPPKVVFQTRIYHCNINSKGVVCVSVLNEDWTPSHTVSYILQALISLLYACNPADPLVGAIALQYNEDRVEHDRIARQWTKRFAM